MKWLTDSSQNNQLPIKEKEPIAEEDLSNQYLVLSKLYVLAKKIMDETTKHIALTAISSRASELKGKGVYPEINAIQTVYEGTPRNSPARQLFVQLYTDFGDAYMLKTGGTVDPRDSIPTDFLFDLSCSLLGNRVRPELTKCNQKSLEVANEQARRWLAELTDMSEKLRVADASTHHWKALQVTTKAQKDEAARTLAKTEAEMTKLPGGSQKLGEMRREGSASPPFSSAPLSTPLFGGFVR